MRASYVYLWIEASIMELENTFWWSNLEIGIRRNVTESCVYKKVSGSKIEFLVLYVNDIFENDNPKLESMKTWFGKYFAIKDLGNVECILGIKIYKVDRR